MGLLDRAFDGARSLIMEDEGNQTPPAPVPVQPVQTVVQASVAVPTRTFVDTSQIDPEIKANLDAAVRGANQASYTEFVNFHTAMLSALSGADERTVYKAALAAANGKGFSPQEVARGIDAILRVFDTEESEFNNMVAQRMRERVGTRREEREKLAQRIAQLEAEILASRTRQDSLSAEIRGEEQKVEETKRKFSATLAVERSRYAEERTRILSYGGKES